MAGLLSRWLSPLTTARVAAKPFSEQGVAGFAAYGGYISNPEKNPDVVGLNRWHTAQDILTNISIVAASVRYTLSLISSPKWKADPPSDKPEAKAMAEFVEEVLNGIDTSWPRIVRRTAMYRYHGFGIHEWVAKKRDDGKIGIASLEQRPVHTIRKWDLDENGGIVGVIQVSPQTGEEIYLPRKKFVYLVDDALTDSPEGMGWFRHMAEPSQRLRRFLKLETMGFERDLAGIPVGRAPLQRINQLVSDNKLSKKQADEMIKALTDFVTLKAKEPSTGLVLDSEPFRAKTETGETVSSVMQWGMELLTGNASSVGELGSAIQRLMLDMALVIGTDSLLVGHGSRGSSGGSRALSEDKSKNLYLTSNAALSDMAEAMDRDVVTTIWNMNGFPDELRPKLTTEDVSFKDAEGIAAALANMATAGAILDPNDPAINDVRDLMGISEAPPVSAQTAQLMLNARTGAAPPNAGGDGGGGGAGDPGRPSRENPGGPGGKPTENPSGGAGRAKKSDPAARTLYVRRNLINADPLIAWAKANGFETTLPAAEMHVTVAFSREPFDWSAVQPLDDAVKAKGGKRAIERLGDKGAVVLLFPCAALSARWKQLRGLGASWDFPGYRPHVSITYQGDPNLDIGAIKPYAGPLEFGPEIFEEVNESWSDGVTEKFDPNEARDDHGRWTDSGGAVPLTRDLKAQLTSVNVGKSVGVMRSEAAVNQKSLDTIGADLEARNIASYEPPPPGYEVKSTDSVMRKMRDEGYSGPHEITDYSRASFVIDHPAEAGQVIDSLKERGTVYDKNWQYLERTGYLDRKVYLQHPNGGLSEIQITPRGVFQVKMGAGHRLYEIARVPSTPREVASAAMRKSRNLYQKVISRTPFAQLAIRRAA